MAMLNNQMVYIYIYILVGGLEHFFPKNMEFHNPNWRTPSFFRGVGIPPTIYIYISINGICNESSKSPVFRATTNQDASYEPCRYKLIIDETEDGGAVRMLQAAQLLPEQWEFLEVSDLPGLGWR